MRLLALDLGTVTGYALSPDAGAVMSGTWNNKGGRFEGGGMRYVRFRGNLESMLKAVGRIDMVVFEEVRRHRGTDAAHVYGGMLATLTAWCEEKLLPYEGITVQAIKKFITGKGNAGKDEVIAAVTALGYKPADDNEADAIALLLHKRDEMDVGRGRSVLMREAA